MNGENTLSNKARRPVALDDSRKSKLPTTATALTPLRARIADGVIASVTIVAGICAIAAAFHLGAVLWWQLAMLAGTPALAHTLSRIAFNRILKKSVRVEFTRDEFVIHGFLGKRRFDRNLPHRFVLYPHDQAERETDIINFRTSHMRRSLWRRPPKRYLGSSYHLSYDHLDQRNDIMTIYRREVAHQILARLKKYDAIMDGYAQKGAGQALTPEQEWSLQAGDLHIAGRQE